MRIKELIGATGMSDAELAVRLGVSPVTVFRWRTGRKVPTPHLRKPLCKAAGVFPVDVAWDQEAESKGSE